jgi:hypothetical protein
MSRAHYSTLLYSFLTLVRATFSSSMDPEQWFKGSVLWLRADSCPMSVIVGIYSR